MVVGQPWTLDVTSFGLVNPETNELGWGAQLKNEGGASGERKVHARGVGEYDLSTPLPVY